MTKPNRRPTLVETLDAVVRCGTDLGDGDE